MKKTKSIMALDIIHRRIINGNAYESKESYRFVGYFMHQYREALLSVACQKMGKEGHDFRIMEDATAHYGIAAKGIGAFDGDLLFISK